MKKQLVTLALSALAMAGASTTTLAIDSIDASNLTSEDSLERALSFLEQQVRDKGATRSDYEAAAKLLIERAEQVLHPEVLPTFEGELWGDLDRAIADLEQKARDKGATVKDYQNALDVLLSRARSLVGTSPTLDARSDVRRALQWLAQQAEERNATRQQYEDAADQIIARAQEHFGPDEEEFMMFATSVEKTLEDMISRLERAVRAGTVKRSHYTEIVDMLTKRAEDVNAI